jgi:hypothetical protein
MAVAKSASARKAEGSIKNEAVRKASKTIKRIFWI